MKNIRLHQEQWDQAKALFEKFVLAGDGSFVDRETPHQIKAMYQIGNTSVCIGWQRKYRDTPSSNRPVCSRLVVLVEQLAHQTKNSMKPNQRSAFIAEANELATHLGSMWNSHKNSTGVVPVAIHFKHH